MAPATRVMDRAPRLALAAFVTVVVGAVPFYLVRGRDQWFFQDEWDFLARRDGGSFSDLMRPHNEHWSTLPIIAYRVLWRIFGLNQYAVYQSLAIGAHLTVAVLLYLVIRRAGVAPWITTVVAAGFVLFGSGYGDIVWGFQIGYVGAAAFGLIQLLLADHDGPFSRRDALGLVAGLAALMSSGVGVTMVLTVGVATLLRRGWRMALASTAPLGAVYLAWFLAYGHDGSPSSSSSVSAIVRFASRGLANTFLQIGNFKLVGLALAVVLVAGLAVAGRRDLTGLRHRGSVPLALLTGALLYFVVAGAGRVERFGTGFATRSRYAHIGAILVLPAVALAADALARRWRLLAVPAVVLLLAGVPGNVGAVETMVNKDAPPGLVLAVANSPALPTSNGDTRPFRGQIGLKNLTVDWLREGVASGRIPRSQSSAADRTDAAVRLALYLDRGQPRPSGPCRPFPATLVRRFDAGDSIAFSGAILVAVRLPGERAVKVVGFGSRRPTRLVSSYGPIELTISPFPGAAVQICD